MTEDAKVLVVDDDRPSAEEYARLIRTMTGLTVHFTDDPDNAVEVVRSGKVCVAVLDQRMPLSGTELFVRLRAEDPNLRGILLTAQATNDEVGSAMNLGFKEYLNKQNVVTSLPTQVMHQFSEYQKDLQVAFKPSGLAKLFTRKRHWWSTERVVYRIFGTQTLRENYIFDEDWLEVLILQAGQTKRVATAYAIERKVVVERESSASLKSALGISDKKISGFTSSLESQLSARTNESITSGHSAQSETEQTFQLPPEPSDPHALHVRARRVQVAPTYRKLRVDLLGDCRCCSKPHILPVILYRATGATALRHVDQMSDGTTRVVLLGETPPRT